MIVYDSKNRRLTMFNKQATPEFWDSQWKKEDLQKKVSSEKLYHFIKRFTLQHIPIGGRILEGGCGIGQIVYNLKKWGYESYGVDFATRTIQTVHSLFPNLNLSVQDVRHTNFPDQYFDGYWSLGVIEHFWNGYDDIILEAQRVIKPDGYFFLTFPVMSPLRKLKARIGLYQPLDSSHDTSTFYEFMLDKNRVVDGLKTKGFSLVSSYSYDALKGLKDETPLFQPTLQRLYNSQHAFARGFRFFLTLLLARLTGHMVLLVLKKTH